MPTDPESAPAAPSSAGQSASAQPAAAQPAAAESTARPLSAGPWSADQGPPGSSNSMSELIDRDDRKSWQRWVFPGIWLVYLTQTASGVAKHSHGFAAICGYVIIVVFSAVYLNTLPWSSPGERRKYAAGLGTMSALLVIETFLAHQDAFAMSVYIAVLCIAGLRRLGPPAVVVLTAVAVFTPALVPSWHSGPDWAMLFTMAAVSLAMYGFFAILQSNRELSMARTEVARLAAENERSRIARDLHDLLGHSLTTITVKAALARRLVERDPQRAAQEIGEVEDLTRTTLTDVRAAVAGYREITLAGELSTAQEVLRAAGIVAQTPRAIDAVPAEHRQLFAWVVREGVTNVMRHSRAQVCIITIGPDWLEIVDDGRGGSDTAGTGLRGLRERVAAAGGTVQAGGGRLGGWTLRVSLSPVEDGNGALPQAPTAMPAEAATAAPTATPTATPAEAPTAKPAEPAELSTAAPTATPTATPAEAPTAEPVDVTDPSTVTA